MSISINQDSSGQWQRTRENETTDDVKIQRSTNRDSEDSVRFSGDSSVLTKLALPIGKSQEASIIELGNGDTLAERIEQIDLEETETVSTEELREELGL
jgi:hypothetical protein